MRLQQLLVAFAVLAVALATASYVWAQDASIDVGPAESPDRNTGDDGTREEARECPIDRTIIDTVSCVDGDMHDWKYFRIPLSGIAEVVFTFDNLGAQSVVVVRDSKEQELARLEQGAEPTLRTILHVAPGIYTLEISCQAERSDYTFEVNFQSGE